ncbi:hypothetical protein [Shewanella halifaxensis]|uniref:hypothetical protein n=1 Tax=Shewanella halifaxensis TaxID=271098 RepID=UPI0002E102A2|nr:hypothetical protein [Shewanella halifaxensis]
MYLIIVVGNAGSGGSSGGSSGGTGGGISIHGNGSGGSGAWCLVQGGVVIHCESDQHSSN